MAQIDDHTKRGLDTAYSDTGAYNALDFAMEQKLRNGLTTSFVGRVDACSGKGSDDGSGSVSATQLTAQADASGKSLPMPSMSKLPYVRVQGASLRSSSTPSPETSRSSRHASRTSAELSRALTLRFRQAPTASSASQTLSWSARSTPKTGGVD